MQCMPEVGVGRGRKRGKMGDICNSVNNNNKEKEHGPSNPDMEMGGTAFTII